MNILGRIAQGVLFKTCLFEITSLKFHTTVISWDMQKRILRYFSSSPQFIYVLCKSWWICHIQVWYKFFLWFVTNFNSKVGLGGLRHFKFSSCRGRRGWNSWNFGVVCVHVFLNKIAEPKLVFSRYSCVILCYSMYFPFSCECFSSLSIHYVFFHFWNESITVLEFMLPRSSCFFRCPQNLSSKIDTKFIS